MTPNDIIELLRKIFVDEDIQANKESLIELHLLSSGNNVLEDSQRKQTFIFKENCGLTSISRKYTDYDCNVLSTLKAKSNIDIVKLNIECIALEKLLETNNVVFKIFSLMRNVINENIGLYYPVETVDGVIYKSEKIAVSHQVHEDDDGITTINMIVKYTDKENNMMYCCEYHVNENQDKSYILQTLSGI